MKLISFVDKSSVGTTRVNLFVHASVYAFSPFGCFIFKPGYCRWSPLWSWYSHHVFQPDYRFFFLFGESQTTTRSFEMETMMLATPRMIPIKYQVLVLQNSPTFPAGLLPKYCSPWCLSHYFTIKYYSSVYSGFLEKKETPSRDLHCITIRSLICHSSRLPLLCWILISLHESVPRVPCRPSL